MFFDWKLKRANDQLERVRTNPYSLTGPLAVMTLYQHIWKNCHSPEGTDIHTYVNTAVAVLFRFTPLQHFDSLKYGVTNTLLQSKSGRFNSDYGLKLWTLPLFPVSIVMSNPNYRMIAYNHKPLIIWRLKTFQFQIKSVVWQDNGCLSKPYIRKMSESFLLDVLVISLRSSKTLWLADRYWKM